MSIPNLIAVGGLVLVRDSDNLSLHLVEAFNNERCTVRDIDPQTVAASKAVPWADVFLLHVPLKLNKDEKILALWDQNWDQQGVVVEGPPNWTTVYYDATVVTAPSGKRKKGGGVEKVFVRFQNEAWPHHLDPIVQIATSDGKSYYVPSVVMKVSAVGSVAFVTAINAARSGALLVPKDFSLELPDGPVATRAAAPPPRASPSPASSSSSSSAPPASVTGNKRSFTSVDERASVKSEAKEEIKEPSAPAYDGVVRLPELEIDEDLLLKLPPFTPSGPPIIMPPQSIDSSNAGWTFTSLLGKEHIWNQPKHLPEKHLVVAPFVVDLYESKKKT